MNTTRGKEVQKDQEFIGTNYFKRQLMGPTLFRSGVVLLTMGGYPAI